MVPFIAVAFHIYIHHSYIFTCGRGFHTHTIQKLLIFFKSTNSIFTKLSVYLDIDIMLLFESKFNNFHAQVVA